MTSTRIEPPSYIDETGLRISAIQQPVFSNLHQQLTHSASRTSPRIAQPRRISLFFLSTKGRVPSTGDIYQQQHLIHHVPMKDTVLLETSSLQAAAIKMQTEIGHRRMKICPPPKKTVQCYPCTETQAHTLPTAMSATETSSGIASAVTELSAHCVPIYTIPELTPSAHNYGKRMLQNSRTGSLSEKDE
ncbi:hypothetical protein CHS0354_007703 [Potamilus streckersoni]|uniref:Uncharacterized protein n=1 Tax=Potamilus streckersoni TaxID=2493646 RepID=A0AAE0VVP9_9BIVA|nr:hypothetical protein CHS0354_007703 [Potamilus streckersoni]